MKKEQREKVTKEYYDVFIAKDGTEFTNAKECSYYEETAYGVISARFCAIAKRLEGDKMHYLDSVIDADCGSTVYYRVTPKDEAEVNIVMSFAIANDCYFSDKDTSWGIHTNELKAGTTYILALFESGACILYSKDRLMAGITKALTAFDEDEEA